MVNALIANQHFFTNGDTERDHLNALSEYCIFDDLFAGAAATTIPIILGTNHYILDSTSSADAAPMTTIIVGAGNQDEFESGTCSGQNATGHDFRPTSSSTIALVDSGKRIQPFDAVGYDVADDGTAFVGPFQIQVAAGDGGVGGERKHGLFVSGNVGRLGLG